MALTTARILENKPLSPDVFELALSDVPAGRAGQFLMLHLPDSGELLLPRPISLFDAEGEVSRLVYRVVGRGTRRLSQLEAGGELCATGPLGNGFPIEEGGAALIGGGLGIAPLYLLAKSLKAADPAGRVSVFLGYSDRVFLEKAFERVADEVVTDVGGYVTERVDFSAARTYYACGPAPMMRAAYAGARRCGQTLYVSLENRMACGVGACFACSVQTRGGNRRVCKDGPVFLADEVYDV